MARQLKPYIDKIKERLGDKYNPKNDGIILDTAIADAAVDDLFDCVRKLGPIIREIGCEGQTKIKFNTAFIELRKMLAQSLDGNNKLGLGNYVPNRIAEVDEQQTELDKFLESLTNE